MSNTLSKRTPVEKNNRLAVSAFFLINGLLYANWVSRLPELQATWGVSNTTLGTLLLVSAAGAILAMPFAGILTHHFGSRRVTQFTAILICFSVPLLAVLSNVWVIGIVFFFLGINGGSFDVAMNGQAVYVERLWHKPIMSSFHAVFSIGMAGGAGMGVLFAKFQMPLIVHFSAICAICLVIVGWASFHLLKEEKNTADTEGAQFRLPTRAILPLGIIAFCGMMGEGTLADWSALYMNKVVGKDEAFSALAFGSFATAMTIGRIFGDYFTARLGRRRLLIANSVLAILGISIVIFFPQAYMVLLGLFISGLGLATVVPIIYSAAGNTEGVAPSVGIAMATTVGYAGFFVGPPVIGYLADLYSLRVGFGFTLGLFLVMLVLVYRKKFD